MRKLFVALATTLPLLVLFAGSAVYATSYSESTLETGKLAPYALISDSSGNLYATDNFQFVYKITPAGTVSTFATLGNAPDYTAFDQSGNLYVSSLHGSVIYKITPSGTVTTFANITTPGDLVIDKSGNLYTDGFSGTYGDSIYKITPSGSSSIVLPNLSNSQQALAVDSSGNLYVSEGAKIQKVTPSGSVSTFASGFSDSQGMAFDSSGNLYVADYSTDDIYKITPSGSVSTFTSGLVDPSSLAFDPSGDLVVEGAGNTYVISPAGVITSTISSGITGSENSLLQSLVFDASGNFYVGSGTTILKFSAISEPAVTITSSLGSSMQTGQTSTISAATTPGSGDTVTGTEITEAFNGGSQTTETSSNGTTASYSFTPTTAGTYVFYGYGKTSDYSSWYNPSGANTTITVTQAPSPTCSASLSPNPASYSYSGTPVTLSWSFSNASTMYINNVGYVGTATGTTEVSTPATSTVDYTCYAGNGTATSTSPATLTITSPALPTATIAASSTSIQAGQSTNITSDFTVGSSTSTSPTPTIIFLTSGSSWTVPSDWNSASNTIEVIGGGGGAKVSWSPVYGGGGGAYSKVSNVSLSPGVPVDYAVGAGGSASGTAGGDTYFCTSISNCTSISGSAVVVGAKGGGGGNTSAGVGGAAGSGVGTTKYSGGSASSGGGGAGGPHGPGANGGAFYAGGAGGGGGGGGGGSAGAAGTNLGYGGAGGENYVGAGGGAGDTGNGCATGTVGGGGGGGDVNDDNGCAGGAGTDWDSSHGSGGGGGSAGSAWSEYVDGGSGGSGGLYGGGAGGDFVSGQSGARGIIVIIYYPLVSSGSGDALTADNIDEPLGSGQGATTNPDASKTITFSTTTPGTYTFWAMAQTDYYSSWAAYASTTVTVTANPSCTVSLSPTSITQGGNSTLSYSSSNATSFSINNVGSLTPDTSGQVVVSPSQSTDYTGTASVGSVNSQCTAAGTSPAGTLAVSCTPTYSCSGQTIEYTNSSCNTSAVTTCVSPQFCQAGSNSCLYPPITSNVSTSSTDLQIVPNPVLAGNRVNVSWNMEAQNCSVTGNGDSWTGLSGSYTSKPIEAPTTYTLVCTATGDATTTASQTVRVAPTYNEI